MLRVALPCLLLALGCEFSAPVAGGAPDPDGGRDSPPGEQPEAGPTQPRVHRIEIAAGKVTGGPHTGFPVLVALTEPWLRGTAAGGEVAHPAGFDLHFASDAAGAVPLAHELERYDGVAGELVAWVKLPTLSPTTVFYVHHGDASITASLEDRPAVWSAGYAAVWHLTDIADATAQNPGTNAGSSGAPGKIIDARAFTGSSSAIDVASAPSVDNLFTGGGTVEAWFTASSWGQNGLGRLFDKGAGSTVAIGMCDANVQAAFLFGHGFSGSPGNWCSPVGSLALNTWTHVAVVYDDGSASNTPVLYINGTQVAVTRIATPSGTGRSDAGAALTIGDRVDGTRGFAGRIDEARLSTVVRGPGWVATSYENMRDPASFCVAYPEP